MRWAFIFYLVLLFASEGQSQADFSVKTIDSLIGKIGRSKDLKMVSEVQRVKCWSAERGNYYDTVSYAYSVTRKEGKLAMASFKEKGKNRDILYYSSGGRTIAAKVPSDSEYPSWRGTTHYFKAPYKRDSQSVLLLDIGSTTEEDIRQVLQHDGESILRYFRSAKQRK